ncbi:hypothetical protein NP233_g11977 [Leucocoprinus birnbaumii]|uniref:HMG domain-containing protein n=1 Tax=Leucocoprinus birnbaumii TaxID=56174 RepID=A0AAD5VFU0_9AGAR|nr:hypothetical protein NP233_g11977 [Leucocoprinus birnbaumii]
MSLPNRGILKTLPGHDSLEKYPRVPPSVQILEPSVSIYSRKTKTRLPEIISPTKRTRASDTKPRAKRVRRASSDSVAQKKWNDAEKHVSHDDGVLGVDPELDAPVNDFIGLDELPSDSPQVPDGTYSSSVFAEYVDAVNGACAGYDQIARNICVVQGWDVKRCQTTAHWYHLQFIDLNGVLKVACQCPINECLHKRYMCEYYSEKFASNDMKYASEVPLALINCERIVGDMHKLVYSATTNSLSTPMNRALVTYEGLDNGEGKWTCSKDSRELIRKNGFCMHIKQSRKDFARRFGLELEDLNDGSSPNDGDSTVMRVSDELAVSYLPILPPIWAELPTDAILYPRARPIRELQEGHLFRLASNSTCSCSTSHRSYFDPSQPVFTNKATLYTLTGSFDCLVELQTCPHCPPARRKNIGPDLREFSVFNYNNVYLLTHELLDDYTNTFTSSETPFDSWCEMVVNRYVYTPGASFMRKNTFRACWFAYARLQKLEGDFQCPDCGPHPDNVIWDGVSLSFGLEKLSGSLEPPTTTSSSLPIRPDVKYFPKQQALPDSSLRKLLRKIITMEPLNKVAQKAASNTSPQKTRAQQSQHALNVVTEHLDNVERAIEHLNHHNEALGSLFRCHYGITTYHKGHKVPEFIKRFFNQISAEESILQMINQEGLRALAVFLKSPRPTTTSALIIIPHLYYLLESGYDSKTGYETSLLSISSWIHDRARDVLDILIKNSGPDLGLEHSTEAIKTNWEVTGCFYSMPKIRERPTYPRLLHDQQREESQGGARDLAEMTSAACGKYYSTYKKQRLTGGIMVAWCTHSISYGYHCMPGAEGRNNVFSAMITRWPKAPRWVIYDFACALGPYCLLREPSFFADTLFIIDNFHSRDHTKCAPACFASTYAELDPDFSTINTSAAECGNSLILWIRKSVSFMSERRAIIYTKVFLSIINQRKILKRLKALDMFS